MLKVKDIFDQVALVERARQTNLPKDLVFPIVMPSCLVGIELEYEGVEQGDMFSVANEVGQCATTHTDGSLRNRGMELVLGPIRARWAPPILRHVVQRALEYDWLDSNRAGVHIHVNAMDMRLDHFHFMLELYALCEPALFKWVGVGREHSIYCRSWYNNFCMPQYWSAYKRDMKPNTINAPVRYFGLNLKSLSKHGTLEFRHLRSTKDWARICEWMNFILSLKKYATTFPIFTTEYVMETTCIDLLTKVMGEERAQTLAYPGMEDDFKEKAIPMFLCMGNREPQQGEVVPFVRGINPGYQRYVNRLEEAGSSALPLPGRHEDAVMYDDVLDAVDYRIPAVARQFSQLTSGGLSVGTGGENNITATEVAQRLNNPRRG